MLEIILNIIWKLFIYSRSFLITKLWIKIAIYNVKSTHSTDNFKSFIRLYLDCTDVTDDKPSNAPFPRRIESVQYNATSAITCGIRGSSAEKLYLELRLEHLHYKRWMISLCLFYKFLSSKVRKHIYDLILPIRNSFKNSNSFTVFPFRT